MERYGKFKGWPWEDEQRGNEGGQGDNGDLVKGESRNITVTVRWYLRHGRGKSGTRDRMEGFPRVNEARLWIAWLDAKPKQNF